VNWNIYVTYWALPFFVEQTDSKHLAQSSRNPNVTLTSYIGTRGPADTLGVTVVTPVSARKYANGNLKPAHNSKTASSGITIS
jgi:hypothetical protein